MVSVDDKNACAELMRVFGLYAAKINGSGAQVGILASGLILLWYVLLCS
jgi:hypothetical protein